MVFATTQLNGRMRLTNKAVEKPTTEAMKPPDAHELKLAVCPVVASFPTRTLDPSVAGKGAQSKLRAATTELAV